MFRYLFLLTLTISACSSSPKRTILLPAPPKPLWERVWDSIEVDRSKLTDNKSLTVHAGKRVDVTVGKIVAGSKGDPTDSRHQRDKLNGKGRRIYGLMLKMKGYF